MYVPVLKCVREDVCETKDAMHVHARVCGGRRTVSGVILLYNPPFKKTVLSLAWTLLNMLGWWAIKA